MAVCPACNARYEAAVTFCPKDGAQVVADAEQEAEDQGLVGQVIADRYRLTKKLGEGGMGEVYEAQHIYIEKRVALKLLRPEIMSNQEAVTRFYQEARSASQIGHENIVSIDDFGKLPDGRVYLSMEFLQGESLNDALQDPMPLPRALDIVVQVCKGLSAAHAKNIVHRDMKPENVFLTKHDGREIAKILDFGIAKVSGTEGNQHLTRTGTIFGTPHYMSPEQALGKALDHRTDIYSVGVIMYEMFTGSVPFKAESFMGILTQHLTTMPRSPHEQAPERLIPAPVETIILRAMAKNADERYQSIEQLNDDLARVQQDLSSGVPLAGPTVAQPAFAPGLPSGPSGSAAMTTPRTAAPGAPAPWVGAPSGPLPGAPGMPPTAPLTVPATLPPPGFPAPLPMATPYGSTGTMPQRQPPKKGSAGLVIGLVVGVVVLAGGGGAAFVFQDELFGDGRPAAKPGLKGPGLKGPQPRVGFAKAPPVKVPPPGVPWTKVQVTSTPADAVILHDGREVGKTPAYVKVPPDRPISYVIRAAGHQDKTLDLGPGETMKKHVTLDKAGSAPTPAPRPKARPKAAPKPADPYERLR